MSQKNTSFRGYNDMFFWGRESRDLLYAEDFHVLPEFEGSRKKPNLEMIEIYSQFKEYSLES